MNELADPDVSELHQLASKKSQKAREYLEKYESFRGTISEQMGCVLEYNNVVEELKNVDAIIRDEEEGGHGSLKEFESQLNEEEATLLEKKELFTELQLLMTLVSFLIIRRENVFFSCIENNLSKSLCISNSGQWHPGYSKARLGEDGECQGKKGKAEVPM